MEKAISNLIIDFSEYKKNNSVNIDRNSENRLTVTAVRIPQYLLDYVKSKGMPSKYIRKLIVDDYKNKTEKKMYCKSCYEDVYVEQYDDLYICKKCGFGIITVELYEKYKNKNT